MFALCSEKCTSEAKNACLGQQVPREAPVAVEGPQGPQSGPEEAPVAVPRPEGTQPQPEAQPRPGEGQGGRGLVRPEPREPPPRGPAASCSGWWRRLSEN